MMTPPTEPLDDGRSRSGPTAFLAILLVAGSVIVGLLTFIAATGQNDVAVEKERALIASAFRSALEDLGRTATDYSWWDDARDNLIENFDPVWASDNIGSYLTKTFGVTTTLVFTPGDEPVFVARDGEVADNGVDAGAMAGLTPLLVEARESPFNPVRAATGMLRLDGAPHLVAASPLSPQHPPDVPGDGADRGVLVMAKRIDDSLLARFGDRFLVDGLRLAGGVASNDERRVPLFSHSGETLVVLAWTPSLPGANLIAWVLPAVLCGGAVAALLCWRVLTIWREEKRRADHARSEFDAVLERVADAVLIVDDRGQSVTMNDAALRLFKPKGGERAGNPLWRLLRDGDRVATLQMLDALAESGTGLDLAVASDRGKGDPVEIRVSRIGRDGAQERLIVARDIAARKRLEESLRAAKEQAELASRAKSRFLATMTHELRTPLNAIIGFSELIRSQAMGPIRPDGYVGFAEDIHDSGCQLLSVINDILDMASVDAGDVALADDLVTPDEVIDVVIRSLRERARARGVTVSRVDGDGRVPLRADERLFKRMLGNLLSNAIWFTRPQGAATVSVRVHDDGRLAVSVADDGVGIPAHLTQRVFEAFHQVEDGDDRSHPGAGLGLTLTKAMIERHGGTVTLESVEGEGTTVTLWFPKERVLPDHALVVAGLKGALAVGG